MTAWLRHHLAALADALQHIRRAKGSFALNVLVIAIALALPFAGLTLTSNLQSVGGRLIVEPSISVFLRADTPRVAAQALAPTLTRIVRPYLPAPAPQGSLVFVPREAALATLQQKTGIADAVAALGENPLPDAYIITLDALDTPASAARVDTLVTQLSALPEVEQVQVDSAWVKRLAAMLDILRLLVTLLASTLALVVVVVAFNTIRLQVMTQHAEIRVARLVGATDRFIYRPFYYLGALLGTSSGILALGAVALALQPLNQAIAQFAKLYATQFQLTVLSWQESLLLLVASAVLGLVGSAISIRRHLTKSL
ncbi:MAG: permease-like cell division protein FtsX [Pseudomonadota bacterium]